MSNTEAEEPEFSENVGRGMVLVDLSKVPDGYFLPSLPSKTEFGDEECKLHKDLGGFEPATMRNVDRKPMPNSETLKKLTGPAPVAEFRYGPYLCERCARLVLKYGYDEALARAKRFRAKRKKAEESQKPSLIDHSASDDTLSKIAELLGDAS